MSLRVVLAEDNYLVREGTAKLLASIDGVEIVGTCADLDSLLTMVDALVPDVVVSDIRMPPDHHDEGIRASAAIRERHPGIGVVILSQYASPTYALGLLADGAAGRAYLLKERVSDVDEIASAIIEVAAGGSVIDPAVVDHLVAAKSTGAKSPIEWLTVREREVLEVMARGRTNAAIAQTLGVSDRAVEKHVSSLFAKLGLSENPDVNRRVQAVLVYLSET